MDQDIDNSGGEEHYSAYHTTKGSGHRNSKARSRWVNTVVKQASRILSFGVMWTSLTDICPVIIHEFTQGYIIKRWKQMGVKLHQFLCQSGVVKSYHPVNFTSGWTKKLGNLPSGGLTVYMIEVHFNFLFIMIILCYGLNYAHFPKFICWSPNLSYLRMWLYLEIGHLKRWSSWNEAIRTGPNPLCQVFI